MDNITLLCNRLLYMGHMLRTGSPLKETLVLVHLLSFCKIVSERRKSFAERGMLYVLRTYLTYLSRSFLKKFDTKTMPLYLMMCLQ